MAADRGRGAARRKSEGIAKPEHVEQLMSRVVGTCRPDDRLDAAAQIMWERDCGVVPVTTIEDGGAERVVGIVTDRDVCMAAYTQGRRLAEVPVSVAMSHDVRTCRPSDSIRTALRLMAAGQLRRLPVVDEASHLVGILSFADVAREEARSQAMVPVDDLAKTVEALAAPRHHEIMVV
jgi:CBS domain-containing protein